MKSTNQSIALYAPDVDVPSGVYVLKPYGGNEAGGGVVIANQKKKRGKLRKTVNGLFISVTLIFACIGLLFTSVFVAMEFGLLNVRGSAKSRDAFYQNLPATQVLAASVPQNSNPTACVQQGADGKAIPTCDWNQTDYWGTVRAGFAKDKDAIQKAADETGVPARMIVASIAPEQIRLFTSDREEYKKYFEPLKILGPETQFSYGIAGIELKTAKQIEQYTQDHNSPFYAGDDMAQLVAYKPGANADSQRLSRLTDQNHYYDYLYAALYIKEIEAQWASEGYDISGRPDVIVTLYNIGFSRSHPKSNPDMGGSNITLGNNTYNFGELGTIFYRSEELTAIFPRTT
jgi:hypothetical protein